MRTDITLYRLLSFLWLHEPDAEMLARAHAASAGFESPLQFDGDPATLASAYADLFLLNVYPYGTAYTDEWAEINTPDAQRLAALYAHYGYAPPELNTVGAPDHLGLCLGLLDHLPVAAWHGEDDGPRMSYLYALCAWAPVCCFAAERDPGAHPFYRALGSFTRELLLAAVRLPATPFHPPAISHPPDAEPRLRDVVHFLLAPARCGIFLSRSRLGALANALGMRLPFGSRFDVCEWLFAAAGESGRVGEVLQALHAESEAWACAYRAWAAKYPAWQAHAADWLARVAGAQHLLSEMWHLANVPLEVEYHNPAGESFG